eukprot:758660-Hanusia_phi.AAC.1
MADAVQVLIEDMVPELQELGEHELLSKVGKAAGEVEEGREGGRIQRKLGRWCQGRGKGMEENEKRGRGGRRRRREEIRAIVKKRTDFEYRLRKRAADKSDYLKYIEYEETLDKLLSARKARMSKKIKFREVEDVSCLLAALRSSCSVLRYPLGQIHSSSSSFSLIFCSFIFSAPHLSAYCLASNCNPFWPQLCFFPIPPPALLLTATCSRSFHASRTFTSSMSEAFASSSRTSSCGLSGSDSCESSAGEGEERKRRGEEEERRGEGGAGAGKGRMRRLRIGRGGRASFPVSSLLLPSSHLPAAPSEEGHLLAHGSQPRMGGGKRDSSARDVSASTEAEPQGEKRKCRRSRSRRISMKRGGRGGEKDEERRRRAGAGVVLDKRQGQGQGQGQEQEQGSTAGRLLRPEAGEGAVA